MRILVAEPLARAGVDVLRQRHEVDERPGLAPEALREIIGEYDALVVRSQVQVDAALIAAGTRLAVVGRAGVGVDNVDIEAATRAGITVVNAPTGNTIAAAELTMGLLLAVVRRIAAADASTHRGEWTRARFMGDELAGRTLGIIGFGKIGQTVAARARAFDMRVIASDPFLTPERAASFGVDLVDLPHLLEAADVVSLHVPLTRSTEGLIGAAELARMKAGSILLNVSRGGVVDEAALAAALASGHVAGAGIDVFAHEPPTGSPLLDAPNAILTPHLGASSREAQVRVAVEAAEQVLDVLEGRPARAAVNAPLAAIEDVDAIAPYLDLATTLGQVIAQVTRRGVGELSVEIGGALAAQDPAPIVAAALLGVLGPASDERINLVNARALARARGIRVDVRTVADAGGYASSVRLSTPSDRAWSPGPRSDDGLRDLESVAGTVTNGQPRITSLGGYLVEVLPAPVLLVTRHHDRPGTMGRIGLLLGNGGVNIASVHLGRSAPRGEALMALALDDDPRASLVEQIRSDESVGDVWLIRLRDIR